MKPRVKKITQNGSLRKSKKNNILENQNQGNKQIFLFCTNRVKK